MHLCRLTTLGLTLAAGVAWAQNATTAGAPSAPWPTLTSVSVEWPITGDDDADGVVTVRYRQQGAVDWREGLPLRRVPAGSNEGFSWANRHVGSVFDLRPGTTWELELTLVDPDGGDATRSLTVTTRVEPQAAASSRVRAVTPATLSSTLGQAMPGDVLSLAAGSYSGFTVGRDGTEAAPVVIRSAEPLGATVTGNVVLNDRQHVIVEGLRINGAVRLNDARFVTVRGNVVTTTANGIYGYGEPQGIVVVDNVVTGATVWADSSLGVSGNNIGEGIELSGPGHVICWNRVSGFRDAISTLEESEAVNQQSVDICNNDIEVAADDGIEADFTMGNVRLMRNLIRNSFVGISGQPTLGGPLYAIRNVMQNVVYSPFKLHRGSVGDVALHNTVLKCGDGHANYSGVTWSRAYFRNNLFLGGAGGASYGGYPNGSGRVLHLPDADATTSFDYDGLGAIGVAGFSGRIGGSSFSSLAELRSRTTEAHAVQVTMSIFAAAVTFPSSGPFPARPLDDLRLAPGSAAVDVGVVLPNVNADFGGGGPDLGAYELGQEVPHYGPRIGLDAGTGGGSGGGGNGGGGSGGGGSGGGAGGGVAVGGGTATAQDAGAGGGAAGGGEGGVAGGAGCGCSMAADSSWLLGALLLGLRRTRAPCRRSSG